MYKPTTEKHFQYFQERFRYWADFLGEHGWKYYFYHEPMEKTFARITANPANRVVRIELCTQWSVDHEPLTNESLDATARHEAIHLLCANLQWIGDCRYVNDGELDTAAEELVRKIQEVLERLI